MSPLGGSPPDGPGCVAITGANRGLGAALARSFVADGWRVLAIGNALESSESMREMARQAPGRVTVELVDLADHYSIAALCDRIATPQIDLLINNAAFNGATEDMLRTVDELEFSVWPDVFAVNVMAPIHLASRLLPMLARSPAGIVINVSSSISAAVIPNRASVLNRPLLAMTIGPGVPAYAYRTSKAALNFASRQLALDLAPRGVVVGMICPGQVQTGQGGPFATRTADEAAIDVRRVIQKFSHSQSGYFYNHRGAVIEPYVGPQLDWPEPADP